MSHIVTIKTRCKDLAAIEAACRRLTLARPFVGEASLYEGKAAGIVVKLAGWIYPIVINRSTGEIRYDNYNGAWGEPRQLDRFAQAYAIEKAKIEAQRKGHRITERTTADGSIELEIIPR